MTKIEYSSAVREAIKNDEPIVALESTIITHGMPWPENLKTAKSVETTVKRIWCNAGHNSRYKRCNKGRLRRRNPL